MVAIPGELGPSNAAVLATNDLPVTLTNAAILERVAALNAECAAEENRRVNHWCVRNA